MNKGKLNLGIDIVMFFLMMLIGGIGLLIKFVLLPGYKLNAVYDGHVELSFWGLDRHLWGSIHLVFSILLLVLLVFHIVLHWKQIVGIYQKMIPQSTLRKTLAVSFTVLSFLVFVGPFIITPEVNKAPRNFHAHASHNQNSVAKVETSLAKTVLPEKLNASQSEHDHELEISGKMNLTQVCELTGMSKSEIVSHYNIKSEHENRNLGWLRRNYGFTMSEFRTYVENIK